MPDKKVNVRILILSTIACLSVRFFPFHIPNVEPLLPLYMPLEKRFGFFTGSLFVTLTIIPFDIITGHVGLWTLVNVITYSLLSSVFVLLNSSLRKKSFIGKAIIGTLFFDIITGILVGPFLFQQPFYTAFFGQIPFTIIHLISNIFLGFTLSPLIDHWIVKQVCNQTRGDFFLLGKKVL